MPVSIELNNCKCGELLKLKEVEVWSGFRSLEIRSYCPRKRWYSFWKHTKESTHVYMPYPSVNKLKPEVESLLRVRKAKQ